MALCGLNEMTGVKYMGSFDANTARHLVRLLKIKEPTMKELLDIESLVCKLGTYGEQLQKIAKELD